MKNIWIVLAVCLPFPAAAESVSISGKVTDKSGKPVAGIWVGLEKTMIATLTANDGSWSLNGTTGVVSRSTRSIPVTRHLVHEGGRLRVSLDGMDAKGRNLSGHVVVDPAMTAAARAAAEVFDTLLYVRGTTRFGQRLISSTPVPSESFQTGTVALDTNWTVPYTTHGDTLEYRSGKSVEVGCRNGALDVWESVEGTDTERIQMTSNGFELSYAGPGSETNHYPTAAKFRRLTGTPGSLLGRFQLTGIVFRPVATQIPDSVKTFIAADSAMSEHSMANLALTYEFTQNTWAIVGWNPLSFARQFLNEWSYADEGWYHSDDTTWEDMRRYSDSAEYDIAVQIVDSSTVRMTGAKTGEIVTLHAATAANGFDLTYSSSNTAHATGTRQAIPTSCPEAASWYEQFRSANAFSSFTPFAARRYEPGPMPSKPRRILPFF